MDQSLSDNVMTLGMNSGRAGRLVLALGGSAFLIPEDATSMMTLDSAWYQWEPDIVWDFVRKTGTRHLAIRSGLTGNTVGGEWWFTARP